MIVYLDTSAFVKLFMTEVHAEETRSWFDQARPAVTSVITYPEACSALARRAHRLPEASAQIRQWLVALDERWRRVVAIETASHAAGMLALKHRLRGMDAIQLGAAIRLRERLDQQGADEPLRFAAFDGRLLEAAEAEGFATLGGPIS